MQQKQLLIIEDNELNREMLKAILEDEYSLLEAENGQIGLDLLREHKEDVALILLDVMMPVMDGYTFLDIVRKDEELSLIPVIVMTKADADEDEVSALAHGATDFVPKPYRPQVILHRVASLIRLRETAAMINQFQYDRMTGLYSKEFFYQKVREVLNSNTWEEFSILCINLENFKLYNDTFGRKEGDRLLIRVANVVRKLVGEKYPCSRYGADRFLILLNKDKRLIFERHFKTNDRVEKTEIFGNISAKLGLYNINDKNLSVEQMCDRAILAVDSIKGMYDQSFALYDDNLRDKLLREKMITDTMEDALNNREFEVFYQPEYSLTDDCLIGAEALVRWIHPEWGFVGPDVFIPLFEKNGFISYLDQYVWEEVCRQMREWQDKGYPMIPVSVNVSRADVYRLKLVDVFNDLIKKYDLDPECIRIEITETAYTDSPEHILNTVRDLRNCGFLIELDDFGSGYSSLNAVGQMSLDVLKLDMQFVWSELDKPAEKCLLPDVVNMAHRMKLNVIAEGVETRDQMNRLQTMGCDYAQGYYLAKPMRASELEVLLKAQQGRDHTHVIPIQNDDLPVLLMIDNDAEYQKKVRDYFGDTYQVVAAADEDEAEKAVDEIGLDNIHVILLSLVIPNDGATVFMKKLRSNPASWKIPVVSTSPCIQITEEMPLTLDTDDLICSNFPMSALCRRIERLNDMAVLQKRENLLQDKANRDYLTGLLNRRGLKEAMDSLRKDDFPLAICMFDLDDLKTVNDTYGHDAGDQSIAMFADYLRQKSRGTDIRCRYGGDEFVVVFKNIKDSERAMEKCIGICEGFTQMLKDENVPAASSCGIKMCGIDEIPSPSLLEKADRALYIAKKDNKGGCCLWDDLDVNE